MTLGHAMWQWLAGFDHYLECLIQMEICSATHQWTVITMTSNAIQVTFHPANIIPYIITTALLTQVTFMDASDNLDIDSEPLHNSSHSSSDSPSESQDWTSDNPHDYFGDADPACTSSEHSANSSDFKDPRLKTRSHALIAQVTSPLAASSYESAIHSIALTSKELLTQSRNIDPLIKSIGQPITTGCQIQLHLPT